MNSAQQSLFADTPKRTNFSFATSLPPRKEVLANGTAGRQEAQLIEAVKNGAETLLQASRAIGITQAVTSARMSDAIKHGLLKYEGFVIFENRKRKKICLV